jgi:hypothetical protein
MFYCVICYNYGNQVMQTQFKNALKLANIVSIFYIEYYILKLKVTSMTFIFQMVITHAE